MDNNIAPPLPLSVTVHMYHTGVLTMVFDCFKDNKIETLNWYAFALMRIILYNQTNNSYCPLLWSHLKEMCNLISECFLLN